MSEKTVQVKTFLDRKVLLSAAIAGTEKEEARLSIEDVATYPFKDEEQFTYVAKADLLDALARFGWLPEEYLKPGPLDPREAKIQEIVMNLVNTDRVTYEEGSLLDTYEEWEAKEINVSAYRNNAEALIDAGLVTVDE